MGKRINAFTPKSDGILKKILPRASDEFAMQKFKAGAYIATKID